MKSIVVTVALFASGFLAANAAAPDASPEPPDPPAFEVKEVEKALTKAHAGAEKALRHTGRSVALNLRAADATGEDEAEIEAEVDTLIEAPAWAAVTPWQTAGQQPLIVRTGEVNSESAAKLREDLPVMNRILTKTVERETGHGGSEHAMGIVLSTLPGGRRPSSFYLEGYGALFLLNVDFPLVAPAVEEKEAQEKPTNSTWEEAKRELYGQKRVEMRLNPTVAHADFDSEQVESVKNEILKVLKNAGNIRELKPEESVTVVLVGGGGRTTDRLVRQRLSVGSNARRPEVFAFTGRRSDAGESTLTIRVKKADASAFAEGAIDLQEFTKRASVAAY
jgi:hypothetical protein